MNSENNSSNKSFASEYEQYLGSTIEQIKPGQIVNGKVVSIGKDIVKVDINFKSHGIIPKSQFQNSDGDMTSLVGDEVEVYIVAVENDSSQIVLSRERAAQLKVWKDVEDIYANGGTVSGKVIQKVKGGLQLDIGIPAFLPGSQIDIRPHRNLDKFIGNTFECKILKITLEKGNIVISRRAVLMSEREELREETLKVISEGVVMEGTVKNLTEYGAFIDLGGLDGLLHLTDITWGRINHPSQKLEVGQKTPVVVLKYDQEKERVSLGMKQLTDNPWDKVLNSFPEGGKVSGTVVSTTDYGAYVEVEEGIEGLVHVHDISWTEKVKYGHKYFKVGDEVEAVVLNVDQENMRLNLGVKQLQPNPWQSLSERIPVGTEVTGQIKSITEFGIFVGVEDGIDGLVHVNDFSWTKTIKDPKEIKELYQIGNDVQAKVLNIDAQNERLSLGIKQLGDNPWDAIAQRYPVGSKITGEISNVGKYGVFIKLEEGLEGQIRGTELGIPKSDRVEDSFKVGESVEAEVINVNSNDQKILLSIKALNKSEQKEYMSGMDAGSAVTFGDLIDESLKGQK